MGGFNQAKKCHHLKPFGIADFTGTAVLQAACGSRLQLHPCALQLRQTRQSLNIGIKNVF